MRSDSPWSSPRSQPLFGAAALRASSAAAARPPLRRARARRSSSLEARPSAASRTSSSSAGGLLGAMALPDQLDRPPDDWVDLLRRRAVAALDEVAQLVDDDLPALGGGRGERPASRGSGRSERRAAATRTRAGSRQLVEDLVEPVAEPARFEVRVQLGDEPRRAGCARRAHGDARRERRHRDVAERGVDELRAAPERLEVDPGVEADAGKRLRERLRRDAVERQRDRVERARDHRRTARAASIERRERRAAGSLAVQADGQPARLADALDELARLAGVERPGGIVDEDA